jgi:soluble P-type ATPase
MQFTKPAVRRVVGPDGVAAIGNSRNDRLILKRAAFGIAVVQEERAAAETLLAADAVSPDILAAFDLRNPLRLTATLRS